MSQLPRCRHRRRAQRRFAADHAAATKVIATPDRSFPAVLQHFFAADLKHFSRRLSMARQLRSSRCGEGSGVQSQSGLVATRLALLPPALFCLRPMPLLSCGSSLQCVPQLQVRGTSIALPAVRSTRHQLPPIRCRCSRTPCIFGAPARWSLRRA